MAKVKIKICDFNNQLDVYGNWLMEILNRRYEIEISEEPDFVFYSCWGLEHLKYSKAIKIFYAHEGIVPDFNDCDYAISMNDIDFDGRNLRLLAIPHVRSTFISRAVQDTGVSTEDGSKYLDRRFCNFLYSSDRIGDYGHQIRKEFCLKLMDYKHVDCPGKILNNMKDDTLSPRISKNLFDNQIEWLSQYKFTIAFEGTNEHSYTTERLILALRAHSIPIYWGNPLVGKDYNTKAFINCNDFDNDMDAVLDEVKRLDSDDKAYMDMLMQPPMQESFDFDFRNTLDRYIYNIIDNGKRFNKNHSCWSVYGWMKEALKDNVQFVPMKQMDMDFKKPIVIYGSGNYGFRTITFLNAQGYDVCDICDSNPQRKGQYLLQYEILSPNEMEDRYENQSLNLVIAIGDYKAVESVFGRYLDMPGWNIYYVDFLPLIRDE